VIVFGKREILLLYPITIKGYAMTPPLLKPNPSRPTAVGLYYVRLLNSSVMFLVEVHQHRDYLYSKTLGNRNIDPVLFNQVHSERVERIDGTWWGPLGVPDVQG
jgi:hypothetical protein